MLLQERSDIMGCRLLWKGNTLTPMYGHGKNDIKALKYEQDALDVAFTMHYTG